MLATTLTGGVTHLKSRAAEEETTRELVAYKHALFTEHRLPLTTMELTETSTDLEARVARFVQAMFAICDNRRFFCTACGRIGLGPQTLQSGDVVAVLYGSLAPFVLRPLGSANNSEYALIGQCYLHGIMDGEAVRQHRSEGMEDKTFYLR